MAAALGFRFRVSAHRFIRRVHWANGAGSAHGP